MPNRRGEIPGQDRRKRGLLVASRLLLQKTGVLAGVLGAMLVGLFAYICLQEPRLRAPVVEHGSRGSSFTDMEKPVGRSGSWLLRMSDLKDPASLAVRLRSSSDPLSQHLRRQFSRNTRRLLNAYDSSTPPSELLERALIDELNRLIQGDLLHDEQRFADVVLTGQTRRLIAQGQQGEALTGLNRRLLEQAYPRELVKSHKRHAIVEDTEQKGPSRLQILREDILNISRETFTSVRLELTDNSFIEKDKDWRRDLESISVRTIEISVTTQWWDKRSSSEKVKILYDTFDLLKWQYPELTQYVKLKFDDGRKVLDLDFGKYDRDRFLPDPKTL